MSSASNHGASDPAVASQTEAFMSLTINDGAGDPAAESSATDDAPVDPQAHGWSVQKPTEVATDDTVHGEPKLSTFDATPKYEYQGEGDALGQIDEAFESVIFDRATRSKPGEFINVYNEFHVDVGSAGEKYKQLGTFDDERIHPTVRANIKHSGYKDPLPIQDYAIPYLLEGRDIIGVAQTGSGKTAAYLIPIISNLLKKGAKALKPKPNPSNFDEKENGIVAEPCVLIIVPTRELANQIAWEARQLTYQTPVRVASVYGGGDRRTQIADLRRGCDILVGTPGRLADLITRSTNVVSLARAAYTVVDEADEMMGSDWKEELDLLLKGAAAHLSDESVFVMFSATFRKDDREVARQYMKDDFVAINVGRRGSTIKHIHQIIVWVNANLKFKALRDLLLRTPPCRTLIFVNTQRMADVVDDYLYREGFPCNASHAGRSQRDRETAFTDFNSGDQPILVATAAYARGLDLQNTMHVINFDLPSTDYGGITEYIHRIGRTARIGNRGQATSFYNHHNENMARSIVKLLIENEHEVPSFLEEYRPEGDILNFDEDDGENGGITLLDDDVAATGDGGWGTDASAAAPAAEEAW